MPTCSWSRSNVGPVRVLDGAQRDGLLKTDFSSSWATSVYQIPCHGRVQNIGQQDRGDAQDDPRRPINTIERCSGHAGTFGVKKAYHQQAMKIGKPVFKAMAT